MPEDRTAYCVEGCGRPATTSRPLAITRDGTPITELVCWECGVKRDIRYSVEHDGWFWDLRVPNPYPMRLPDGTVSRLDERICESGYARRRKGAERAMGRAERSIRRRIAKAERYAACEPDLS